ncbi:MAG: acyl-CoA dehydrogenase [Acidimicrobiia bacterium]|nr:acyl-CoA dehydrogenase [Acidimicrobiia bacterium]
MGIAISEEHRELEEVASAFLESNKARAAGRALLEAPTEELPPFWDALVDLGWLGLHVDEAYGGSGYELEELAVVVEAMGRAVAPGPFLPTVMASATVSAAGTDAQKQALLPSLVDGTRTGALGIVEGVTLDGGKASGSAGVVLGAGLADLFVLRCGDDLIVVPRDAPGLSVTIPANVDPSRRSGHVALDGVPVSPDAVLAGGARVAAAIARTLASAEAAGGARECTEMSSAYARERHQFGRPIAMFQAVKHHCANMLVATEMATASTWDAARAAGGDLDQFEYASAVAATLAMPAFLECSHLNIQVHGGIGFTWEHDAHLLMRRAISLEAIFGGPGAGDQVLGSLRAGVRREAGLDLGPEAEPIRAEVRTFAREVAGLPEKEQLERLIDTGYVMPHWPEPWGRAASALEQIVIDEEFAAAGVQRPQYGITGWVILTVSQHGTQDQVDRWVRKTLDQSIVWCQLFSEPDAGSDAAGIKTRGTRVEGGWLVNGQKVWTSGARESHLGLATVRTDPEAKKHEGITTMVIDMKGEGVEVRPLKQMTGESHFNEVFFNDVFVPDDDVVGEVNAGWTVARATLGNERVSIGGGSGGGLVPGLDLIALLDEHGDRVPAAAARVAGYLATARTLDLLNLRRASRAMAGSEPGPEGNVTKLVTAESGHERAAIGGMLCGQSVAFLEGEGALPAMLTLWTRGLSIAGGTSEIARNQIGERILGLPRDPLLK